MLSKTQRLAKKIVRENGPLQVEAQKLSPTFKFPRGVICGSGPFLFFPFPTVCYGKGLTADHLCVTEHKGAFNTQWIASGENAHVCVYVLQLYTSISASLPQADASSHRNRGNLKKTSWVLINCSGEV